MKNKNILIVNEYAGAPKYGMTFRHFYLAKEFNLKGYETTIVSAAYNHFFKAFPNLKGENYSKEEIETVNFVWLNVIKYKASFDYVRIIKWFQYAFKLFFISKKLLNKPDVIICSPTAPFCILPAFYLSKKHNAKLIFEVRDIWPLTLIEVGGFSKNNLFIKLMSLFERFAINQSDLIVSNLQNYQEYIKELNINKKSHWVSNGINLSEMRHINKLDEDIISLIPKNKFIVGYTGKLGVSNAIKYLVLAAEKLQANSNIFFVIVGSGQEEKNLKKQSEKLKNMLFIDTINKSMVQSILDLFDICYIGWNKERIYKYGVSPNKIFDYMYSSKPILHSINTSNDIVQIANCGLSVEAENIEEIKNAILKFYQMNVKDRISLGKNGKRYVLENFTYNQLAQKYLCLINENE